MLSWSVFPRARSLRRQYVRARLPEQAFLIHHPSCCLSSLLFSARLGYDQLQFEIAKRRSTIIWYIFLTFECPCQRAPPQAESRTLWSPQYKKQRIVTPVNLTSECPWMHWRNTPPRTPRPPRPPAFPNFFIVQTNFHEYLLIIPNVSCNVKYIIPLALLAFPESHCFLSWIVTEFE